MSHPFCATDTSDCPSSDIDTVDWGSVSLGNMTQAWLKMHPQNMLFLAPPEYPPGARGPSVAGHGTIRKTLPWRHVLEPPNTTGALSDSLMTLMM